MKQAEPVQLLYHGTCYRYSHDYVLPEYLIQVLPESKDELHELVQYGSGRGRMKGTS